jgi:hypothetical protein
MLTEPATFNIDGRIMARWSADDKHVISQANETLSGELKGKLRQQLHPSAESIKHLTHRYRRLYEQGVSLERLRQYVVRWVSVTR